jgi:hypothetical protein
MILPASPVGEHTGGEKLAGLLALWPPLDKFFSPGADGIQLKSGVGLPETNKKYGPRTGYQINLRSGAVGKKIFTSIEQTLYKS